MKFTNLPAICVEHPEGDILHFWKQTAFNTGKHHSYDHKYSCSVCGKELCSPEEYNERMRTNDKVLIMNGVKQNDII